MSDSAHSSTILPTCERMMPCRSTNAFCAPMVTMSDPQRAAPWEKAIQFMMGKGEAVDGGISWR
ncbi:hypothetical protein EMIT0158MI4_100169 [Burkholderia ambifaria]